MQHDGARVTYVLPFPAQFLSAITNTFRADPGEWGVDVALPSGTPIYAPEAGRVAYVENKGSSDWGLRFAVAGATLDYAVGHMRQLVVNAGDYVRAGQLLGYSGGGLNDPNHGDTTGAHIEWQYLPHGGSPNDPASFADPLPMLRALFSGGAPPATGGAVLADYRLAGAGSSSPAVLAAASTGGPTGGMTQRMHDVVVWGVSTAGVGAGLVALASVSAPAAVSVGLVLLGTVILAGWPAITAELQALLGVADSTQRGNVRGHPTIS